MKLRHLERRVCRYATVITLTMLGSITVVKGADLLPQSVVATNQVKEATAPGKEFTNSVKMELVQVPGGFWAGKYEVTQGEYQKVMGSNPSQFTGERMPVDSVTYNDALSFCEKLTKLDIAKKALPAGYRYTLPTEEEWISLVGDASPDAAVSSLNNSPRPGSSMVGSGSPNNLGLYDVLGNVMEYCLGDDSKPFRFLKGGSWQETVPINFRPGFRWYVKPDEHLGTFGFRCVLKNG